LCVVAGPSRVGVRELRQNLSVYLKRVIGGETLEVTEYGHPVARLTPLPRGADAIARLEAEGRLARRATAGLLELGPPLRVSAPISISEALAEQREERR
jgi:prevent-host-death family protein